MYYTREQIIVSIVLLGTLIIIGGWITNTYFGGGII